MRPLYIVKIFIIDLNNYKLILSIKTFIKSIFKTDTLYIKIDLFSMLTTIFPLLIH